GRGHHPCREHPDRGRLARAVRTQQAEDLAVPHLEIESVDRRTRRLLTVRTDVDLRERFGADDRIVGHRERGYRRRLVRRLVPLRLPGGPQFVDALRRAWDDGDAVLPVDTRLAEAAVERLLASMRLDEPVDAGDALVIA